MFNLTKKDILFIIGFLFISNSFAIDKDFVLYSSTFAYRRLMNQDQIDSLKEKNGHSELSQETVDRAIAIYNLRHRESTQDYIEQQVNQKNFEVMTSTALDLFGVTTPIGSFTKDVMKGYISIMTERANQTIRDEQESRAKDLLATSLKLYQKEKNSEFEELYGMDPARAYKKLFGSKTRFGKKNEPATLEGKYETQKVLLVELRNNLTREGINSLLQRDIDESRYEETTARLIDVGRKIDEVILKEQKDQENLVKRQQGINEEIKKVSERIKALNLSLVDLPQGDQIEYQKREKEVVELQAFLKIAIYGTKEDRIRYQRDLARSANLANLGIDDKTIDNINTFIEESDNFISKIDSVFIIAENLNIKNKTIQTVAKNYNKMKSVYSIATKLATQEYFSAAIELTGFFKKKQQDVEGLRHQEVMDYLKEINANISGKLDEIMSEQNKILENQKNIYKAIYDFRVDFYKSHREISVRLDRIAEYLSKTQNEKRSMTMHEISTCKIIKDDIQRHANIIRRLNAVVEDDNFKKCVNLIKSHFLTDDVKVIYDKFTYIDTPQINIESVAENYENIFSITNEMISKGLIKDFSLFQNIAKGYYDYREMSYVINNVNSLSYVGFLDSELIVSFFSLVLDIVDPLVLSTSFNNTPGAIDPTETLMKIINKMMIVTETMVAQKLIYAGQPILYSALDEFEKWFENKGDKQALIKESLKVNKLFSENFILFHLLYQMKKENIQMPGTLYFMATSADDDFFLKELFPIDSFEKKNDNWVISYNGLKWNIPSIDQVSRGQIKFVTDLFPILELREKIVAKLIHIKTINKLDVNTKKVLLKSLM